MGLSTYRCIRVKNEKRPLLSRCGKKLGRNGVLCESCYSDAMKGSIPILMCSDVTNLFNIPFANQVYVKIDLSKSNTANKKTESDNATEIKSQLTDYLSVITIKELEAYYSGLGLTNWSRLKKNYLSDKIVFRDKVIEEILDHFVKNSDE